MTYDDRIEVIKSAEQRTHLAMALCLIFSFLIVESTDAADVAISQLSTSEVDNREVYSKNQEAYEKAIALGARVVNLPSPETFFAYWLPNRFDALNKKRLMVLMHGTDSNAYHHLLSFVETAQQEMFALVSIQWTWPSDEETNTSPKGKYLHLSPDAVYDTVSQAIEYMALNHGVDKQLCSWQGFGGSATHCAAYAFYDRQSSNDYFRLFIATSADTGASLPVVTELASGEHGKSPLKGSHFYLWGGLKDRSRAGTVKQSKNTVLQLGGSVEGLTIGREGQDGFNHNTRYQLEAVRIWKSLTPEEAVVPGSGVAKMRGRVTLNRIHYRTGSVQTVSNIATSFRPILDDKTKRMPSYHVVQDAVGKELTSAAKTKKSPIFIVEGHIDGNNLTVTTFEHAKSLD